MKLVYQLSSILKIGFIGVILLLMTSCANYFGSANFSNQTTIYQKPLQKGDTLIKASYLSGSFNMGFTNPNAKSTFGAISYHKSYTKKKHVYAFGGYAHAGQYVLDEITYRSKNLTSRNFLGEETFIIGKQSFVGGGISGEYAFNIPYSNVDWRVIGCKLNFQYEGGSYSEIRKELENIDVEINNDTLPFENTGEFINLAPNNISFNLSATSEVVFKLNNDSELGLWGSYGIGSQIITSSFGAYFSRNKITGILSCHSNVAEGSIVSTGISYQL